VAFLSLVRNSSISGLAKINKFCRVNNSIIGDCSYVANGGRISNAEVGKFCSIGPDVRIGLGKHPVRNYVSTHPAFYSKSNASGLSFSDRDKFNESERVVIGNDVWIGQSVIVCDGVRIGDGACIAAGAVVTKNVEPYSLVGGVPARFIRYRFDADVIKRLLAIKWWDKDLSWIKKNWELFSDIEAFLYESEKVGEA
jgi:Acetyltransferase (isoleucine patch superfamily)